MTALNMFVQPLACWLLNDTAVYDEHGTILSLASKTVTVPGLPIAMASSGSQCGAELQDSLSQLAPRSVDAVLEALPGVLSAMLFADRAAYPDDKGLGYFLHVATWCANRRQPRGYVIGTDQRAFGPAIEPWNVVEVDHSTSGGFEGAKDDDAPVTPESALGRPVDLCDPSSFNPRLHGLPLIEAQRSRRWRDGGALAYRIGGQAVLTRVSRRGVERTVLREWPDRVGERIAA